MKKDSRFPGIYRLGVHERIAALEERGWLSADDARALRDGNHILSPRAADRMVENVIGSFALPFAIAPNFIVNGREYVVPLVVEEPSVVAALSAAASQARQTGGFTSSCPESLLIGQIYVDGVENIAAARNALETEKPALIERANAVHPRLAGRGGGVRDIVLRETGLADTVAVHLLVDTVDAMGANLVNTLCETLAPDFESLVGGSSVMRILSNLADSAIVTAKVRYDFDDHDARDRIVAASRIAAEDPYRAATHNKGIMNGIDALAIATGNDWRAIEAGAHAYAARDGRYRALSEWRAGAGGELHGTLSVPLKLGIVGGTLESNPAARIGLSIAGVESAVELAELAAAVGLGQNFSALRALATTGIQHGHMRLHARSVAARAGTPDDRFDDVVSQLVDSGDVKLAKATEILRAGSSAAPAEAGAKSAGKVILLGEHAAVYGRHALAMPMPGAVSAAIERDAGTPGITIPAWGVRQRVSGDEVGGIVEAVRLIASALEISADALAALSVRVDSVLPRAMGLGSSAAVAVAVTRALAESFDIDADDEEVNRIAFECEKLAHGTPSGVDNAIAMYARPLLFRRNGEAGMRTLELGEAPPLLIACSSSPGLTSEQVAGVRERRDKMPAHYDAIFDEMDALAIGGADALVAGDYEALGERMNLCHGLLNAIGVSTPELERMVVLARSCGAVGAKLTGGGGGGSIVALCPGTIADVRRAFERSGFRTITPGDTA